MTYFLSLKMDMTEASPTEAVLKKLSKPDLVRLILNIKTDLESQIAKLTTEVKNLLAHSKKLEEDVTIVRNVNSKLIEKVKATEHQCWGNTQYSMRETLEVVRIPTSLGTMYLSRRFAASFVKLTCIYVTLTLNRVIV